MIERFEQLCTSLEERRELLMYIHKFLSEHYHATYMYMYKLSHTVPDRVGRCDV